MLLKSFGVVIGAIMAYKKPEKKYYLQLINSKVSPRYLEV